ncbi:hypothetical protein HPB52_021738 [Rhipicephalus sanguineus]|uniref:Uncharacterized protein n=1 Tax=Rhipicephalus sanguineus TaxID=34632 RepID=A0A9D4Q7S6_RHISA|nr:hypothetical protein HPB52_021738 [Rhipicephalus sanguineus]
MPPVYGNSMEVLRELVRSVVREELQKQRLDQNAPMISSLADVIREEVRQAVREPQLNTQPELPLQQQPRMSYADALLRGPPGRVDVAAATPMQHPIDLGRCARIGRRCVSAGCSSVCQHGCPCGTQAEIAVWECRDTIASNTDAYNVGPLLRIRPVVRRLPLTDPTAALLLGHRRPNAVVPRRLNHAAIHRRRTTSRPGRKTSSTRRRPALHAVRATAATAGARTMRAVRPAACAPRPLSASRHVPCRV